MQNQSQSNLKLHITPEENPIEKDFFKDEFTHYTSIAYKDESNYIMIQNGVGYLVITDGAISKKYLNSSNRYISVSYLEDNYYIYDEINCSILRTSSSDPENQPEIVLENFQGYSKETIKSVGEGTHHLALNCGKYLNKKIILFNTIEKKLTFAIFDPNSESEPFSGAISRFEIIDKNTLIVLTDSGLVDKIIFDCEDESSPKAVANGLVEPFVDEEGEEDFSVGLAITNNLEFTIVTSYIKTEALYLCQVMVFNTDFEIVACENFLKKEIFQIHNFTVFGEKGDEVVLIGLTNSKEVEVVLFGFNKVTGILRLLVNVKCKNGLQDPSGLVKKGENCLEAVNRDGKKIQFSFD